MLEIFRRGENSTVLCSNAADTVPAGTIEFTTFCTRLSFSTAESTRSVVIARRMRLRNFFVSHGGGQAVSNQDVTIRIDGIDTTIIVVIPAGVGAGVRSDLINEAVAAAGSLLSVSMDSPAGSTPAQIRAISIEGVLL